MAEEAAVTNVCCSGAWAAASLHVQSRLAGNGAGYVSVIHRGVLFAEVIEMPGKICPVCGYPTVNGDTCAACLPAIVVANDGPTRRKESLTAAANALRPVSAPTAASQAG